MPTNLDARYLNVGAKGYVEIGIKAFDDINAIIGAKSYIRSFDDLYDVKVPGEVHHFKSRHEAWGFHLLRVIEFDEKFDVLEAVRLFAELDEVEYAEPVFIIRRIEPVKKN
jgi:adenosine/AMP kinase